jgi:NitT/TauT family transport system permease protein
MADAIAVNAPSFAARRVTERRLSVFLPLIVGAVILVAWQILVTALQISPVILPGPVQIAAALVANAGELGYEMLFTGGEAFLACAIAALFGVAVALLLALSRTVREMIFPYIVAAQFIPKVALAPLFIIWLGIGSPARLVFAVFMSFFPIAIATLTGLTRTSPTALMLCRSLTANRWQTLLFVRLPYAMPLFFSGMRVAATISVLGILVGEFISAQHGLGSVLLIAASHADTALVFATILVLCAMGLALFGAVVLAERRFSHQSKA